MMTSDEPTPKKNLGGRPPKFGVTKLEHLHMRLTPGLKAKMFKAAELAGNDVSNFWLGMFNMVSDRFIAYKQGEITREKFMEDFGKVGTWLILDVADMSKIWELIEQRDNEQERET